MTGMGIYGVSGFRAGTGKEPAAGEQPESNRDAVIDMSTTQHQTHAMSEQSAASLPSQGMGDHERIDGAASTFGEPAPRDDEGFEPTIIRGRE